MIFDSKWDGGEVLFWRVYLFVLVVNTFYEINDQLTSYMFIYLWVCACAPKRVYVCE